MRLIIREYLSLLKESDELDRLLPDLLLAMGIEPISRAQVGVRQYGVDVAAVGKDKNGKKTLFLFTIKQGDIGRADWDRRNQSVRQSLNEIKDVYLTSSIEAKYKTLPKKIILCTGGDLKQEAETNWKGYVKSHQKKGKIEYDFWGNDRLSLLIEKHLFNEHILPNELRSKFRKLLALLSDPDYDLSDYYMILEELLIKADYGNTKKLSVKKKIKRALRTINLCQSIIYFWAKNENNIKSAIYCSERTVLNAWEFMRKNELYSNREVSLIYLDLYRTLFRIYTEYFRKVQGHCYVRNGFSGYGRHYIQECLNTFEHLGLISTAGLLYLYQASFEQNKNLVETLIENSKAILDAIKSYIRNHHATGAPCFDSHIIEISEAIYLLSIFSEKDLIDNWVKEVIDQIVFSYDKMEKYFPIQSDSFDDLVALCISDRITKDEMFEMSTLLPILAQWCIVLDLSETYLLIHEVVSKFFPKCTLQIWYPDDETDQYIYTCNAAYKSGAVDAPIKLDVSLDEMKKRINEVQSNTIKPVALSCIKHGLEVLPILASRHYRTPLLPFYWQKYVLNKVSKAA